MKVSRIGTPLVLVSTWFGFSHVTNGQTLNFFTTPDQSVVIGGGSSGGSIGATDSDSVAVTLGGLSTTRTLTATLTGFLNPTSVGGDLIGGDGRLILNQGVSESSVLVLEWGAGSDMNLNMLSYGNSFSFVHFANDGNAGSQVEITVWNGTASFAAPATTLTHASFDGSGMVYEYLVPFSAFSGADFSDVDRISFALKAVSSADVEIANFSVVPESSTALLGVIGGLLACLRRKRMD